MKKINLIIALFVSFFIISCTNKVSDKLSVSDAKTLIQKDTLYEKLIPKIQKIQDSVSKNVLLSAKYSDITYQQCLEFEKQKIKEREIFIKKHIVDIDKKINDIKNKIESFQKMMKIEFYSTNTYFYEYIGGVENAYINFKISVPEPIQGGSFTYSVIDKSTGKEVVSGGCRFSKYVKDSFIATYEIPYLYQDEFIYQTSNETKNKYIFNFTILSVYKNNTLQTDSLSNDITLTSDIYKSILLVKYKIDLYQGEYNLLENWTEKNLYELAIFNEYGDEYEKICKNLNQSVYEYLSIL